MSSVTVARALTARTGLRVVRLVSLIAAVVFGAWLLLVISLVYFFSPWWWFLLLPAGVLAVLFVLIRLFIRFIIGRIHAERLSQPQIQALDGFVDKIQALLEARATPPWVFALICIKDLVLHRDVTTIKSIISSTATLKHDYQELEKLF